ncbi:MAG: BamA/TamA family outer membrane protein [Acidobacteriota bacterium]|nr:MAG: BamA/TamA family outer membrane protein [Acidobacteriota bacterium]
MSDLSVLRKLLLPLIFLLLGGGTGLAVEEQEISDESSETVAQGPERPNSRKERWLLFREQKRQELKPPEQNIAEQYLRNFDRKGSQSIDEGAFWGFYPRLEWIARGSGAALGVRYWRPEALGPIDLMGSAFYSWRRYQHYDVQFGLIPNRGKRIPSRSFESEGIEQLGDIDQGKFSRFKLYGSLRYRDRTDETFYGPGAGSKRENKFRYRVKETSAEAVTGLQFTRSFGWTVKLASIQHSLGSGRSSPTFEDLELGFPLPEYVEWPDYVRLHSSVLLDLRDDPGVPHRGFMIAFGWEKWDNVDRINQYNFYRYLADARGYIPLGSNQQVIALRGLFVNSDPASGDRVPFFLKPSLGGGESLRGYDAFRFQGDKLFLAQLEYRWEASRRFEFALFGDTGTVAEQGDRLSLDELKSDWGIGFRFKSSRSTLFRVDQAWGNEGARTQIRFSAVF